MEENKNTLELYRDIAPKGTVDLLYKLSEGLKGISLVHVNSTRLGGGVAEMLQQLIPIFESLGISTGWEVVQGNDMFYKATKSFHNALQGQRQEITPQMYEEYLMVNKENANNIHLDSDIVVIHDPQPLPLILKKNQGSTWIWRCHIDISRPQRKVWSFLKDFVSLYDGAIFSLPSFAKNLAIPQILIYPSIDPLSDKNKELTQEDIDTRLEKIGIPKDRPIILQVSRFDRFKDPLGVIDAYRMVKKYNDCCLVLAGGSAADDPEGLQILNEVKQSAGKDKDIFVLDLSPDSHLDINALQRAATVVLQKSVKEGFGLTVAEAMWKGKPVIGGAVGGITAQLVYGATGFTVNSIEGCAYRIRYLLNNPIVSARIGKQAKEFTRRNFLITRHISDYLALMISMIKF